MIADGWCVRAAGVLALAVSVAAPAHAQIPGLRLGVHPGMTRAVLDLVEEAPYQVLLAPDARSLAIVVPNQGEQPRRFAGRTPTRAGLVQAVSVDPDTDAETVVMLRLAKAPQAVRAFPLAEDDGRPLYRVVVDMAEDTRRATTDKTAWTATAPSGGWQQIAAGGNRAAPAPAPTQVAQASPRRTGPLPTDYDSAFREMMAHPTDLDLTFRFAELAIAAGDLEGAVSAFERLLIFNPDLPRIRYELALLYMRLGSNQIAKGYFEDVLKAPGIPADIRTEAQANLAEIDKRLSATTFSLSVQTGLRWQSNANAANSAGVVKLFGLDATLDPASQKRSDWNAYAQAALAFAYDLGTQDRDTIEAGLQLYGTRQQEISSLDLQVLQIDLGPRLRFGGEDGWNLRPYALGSAVTLDDARYFVSYGGGLSGEVPFGAALGLDFDLKSRFRRFHVSEARPTVADKDGWEHGARLGVRFAPGATDLVRATGGATFANTRAEFERYLEYSADLAYYRQFAAPFGVTQQPWVASLSGGRTMRYYDGVDATVDPSTLRYDREWTLGAGLSVRFLGSWSVNLQLQQQWVRSSIENYTYTNTSGTIGLGYAF